MDLLKNAMGANIFLYVDMDMLAPMNIIAIMPIKRNNYDRQRKSKGL